MTTLSASIERISRQEFLDRAFGETDAFMASIEAGAAYVVDSFYPRERVLAFRERAQRWAAAEEPSWHPCLDGVPDYHRIVDDYPGAWVKSRMHAFYLHRFNGNAELFDEFRDIFRLKNHLAGRPEDSYLETIPSDGVISRIVSNQYPRGGGYLAEHRDPTSEFARLQTIIQGSDPGEDFEQGGLYAHDDATGERLDIEPHSRMGDLMVLSPNVRHGVAPVDPGAELDWSRGDGRWMILPVIIRSDYDTDPENKPKQTA